MTVTSIVAGCLAALSFGLLAGRCLRTVRGGSNLAFAIAVTAGLLLLQTSRASDLLKVVQPKTATDWLPLVVFIAAATALIQPTSCRAGSGVLLAVFIPARLLWGSIYLPAETTDFVVLSVVGVWTFVLFVSVLLVNGQQHRLMSWNTAAWGTMLVSSATLIALTGSFVYGAITGICGLAALSVLFSTAQMPNVAAVPVVCLIGLSVAFSTLPAVTAGLLLLAWMSVLTAERQKAIRMAGVVRVGAVLVLLLAGLMTFGQIAESRRTAASSNSGDSAFSREQPVGTRTGDSDYRSAASGFAREIAPTKSESPENTSQLIDPFSGLETE